MFIFTGDFDSALCLHCHCFSLGQSNVFHLNYVTLPVLFGLPLAPPIHWGHHRLKSTGEWSDPLTTSYHNEDCSIWSSHDLFFNLISYYFPTFQRHQLFFSFSNVTYSLPPQDFCTCSFFFLEWSFPSSFYNCFFKSQQWCSLFSPSLPPYLRCLPPSCQPLLFFLFSTYSCVNSTVTPRYASTECRLFELKATLAAGSTPWLSLKYLEELELGTLSIIRDYRKWLLLTYL